MAENITIGGFTKIRIQTSINFIFLWCTPGELNPFDTLQIDKAFISIVYDANLQRNYRLHQAPEKNIIRWGTSDKWNSGSRKVDVQSR